MLAGKRYGEEAIWFQRVTEEEEKRGTVMILNYAKTACQTPCMQLSFFFLASFLSTSKSWRSPESKWQLLMQHWRRWETNVPLGLGHAWRHPVGCTGFLYRPDPSLSGQPISQEIAWSNWLYASGDNQWCTLWSYSACARWLVAKIIVMWMTKNYFRSKTSKSVTTHMWPDYFPRNRLARETSQLLPVYVGWVYHTHCWETTPFRTWESTVRAES